MLRNLVNLIRSIYNEDGFISIHPAHEHNDAYANACSCMKSGHLALGKWVNEFEESLCEMSGAKYCIATNSGTVALHLALMLSGVTYDNDTIRNNVITQSFTYISTANAIVHSGANPVFVDVDLNTMGMCPDSLTKMIDIFGSEYIKACMPMHTLGVKCDIESIRKICRKNEIALIIDGCQAIMTNDFYDGETTCLSFNGNKPITTGGGGAILTDDPDIEYTARKYLNQVGNMDRVWYNYRMPNINAAIGKGAMGAFDFIKQRKIEIAAKYKDFASKNAIQCPTPLSPWLNAFFVDDPKSVKEYLSNNMIESRLGFPLVNDLPMYKHGCESMDMPNAKWLKDHLIMLPSGV